MDTNQEHMWQAYIDGELSATEMASFEAMLNPGDQERLRTDVQFDRGVNERLQEGSSCPLEVWERTKALLIKHSEAKSTSTTVAFRPKRRSMMWGVGTLLAAAGLAFVISTLAPFYAGLNATPIILEAATIDELVSQSKVKAEPQAIEAYMHANNINLDLVPEDSIAMAQFHSPLKLVGASRTEDGEYVELFVGCCKEPVKIIIVHRNSASAKKLGGACGLDCDVQATRIVGDYLTAVVGKHPAHGLLDIFAGQHP